MALVFLQQQENSSAVGPGFIVTPPMTTVAGNLLVVVAETGSDPFTNVISSSAGEVFSASIASALFSAGHVRINLYWAIANGGVTTFTNTVAGSGLGIYVAEYTTGGLTVSVSGTPAGALSNGPGTGANAITSGLLGSSGTVLTFGFCTDAQGHLPGPTAGTGYTGRTGVWLPLGNGGTIATPEDKATSGNAAATFTASATNQFDIFLTVAAAFASPAVSGGGTGQSMRRSLSGIKGP